MEIRLLTGSEIITEMEIQQEETKMMDLDSSGGNLNEIKESSNVVEDVTEVSIPIERKDEPFNANSDEKSRGIIPAENPKEDPDEKSVVSTHEEPVELQSTSIEQENIPQNESESTDDENKVSENIELNEDIKEDAVLIEIQTEVEKISHVEVPSAEVPIVITQTEEEETVSPEVKDDMNNREGQMTPEILISNAEITETNITPEPDHEVSHNFSESEAENTDTEHTYNVDHTNITPQPGTVSEADSVSGYSVVNSPVEAESENTNEALSQDPTGAGARHNSTENTYSRGKLDYQAVAIEQIETTEGIQQERHFEESCDEVSLQSTTENYGPVVDSPARAEEEKRFTNNIQSPIISENHQPSQSITMEEETPSQETESDTPGGAETQTKEPEVQQIESDGAEVQVEQSEDTKEQIVEKENATLVGGEAAEQNAEQPATAEVEPKNLTEEEEAAQKVAEEEARQKAAEEEAARKAVEEEAAIKAAEEEEARKAAEEEAARKVAEEEAARKAAEEEAARKAAEEEARRKAEEEEKARKAAEEEARRKAAEEEAARKAAEEEAARKAAEEEAQRKAAEEEAAKKAAEEEAKRKAAEEEAERKAAEEEAARKAEEEEAKRKAEEEKAKLEKYDSFDVIGDFVDTENRELASVRHSNMYRSSSPCPPVQEEVVLKSEKELSELGRELWDAASQDKSGPAKMLLAAGANPNHSVRTGLMSTSTPLVIAACKGYTSVVSTLLEHPKTQVNTTVSGGWTALMWAAWYGHVEVVEQLLAVPGCKADKLNQAGKSAVMYAAEAGRVEVCKILLDGVEKFDVDEEDRAVRKNRLDKLLDQALKAGCDVPLAKMVLALREMKAELVMTSLHVVG